MAMTMSAAYTVALVALLSKPSDAFSHNQPRCLDMERTSFASPMDKVIVSRENKFALSARDTIFSINDDDDDDKTEEAESNDSVDSEDIADIVNSMMAEENAANSIVEALEEGAAVEGDNNKIIGDPLREDNGVRPSIHPTTINAIAEALKARATQSINSKKQKKPESSDDDDDDDMMHFRVSEDVDPLMVMVTAGQFASDAIQKRQESSSKDGMLLNQGEEQTLAGRVMGVIMRLDTLEEELAERAASVDWVAKYGEWGSFGVLEGEHENNVALEESGNDDDDGLEKVHAKIVEDPLFCMNRAECLLAIFLQEVEIPQLKKLNESVPDESKIDFLDADRREVVLGDDE